VVKTNRKIVTIALSIATAHFFLTSIVGYYVGAHVGSQVGQVIAKGMIDIMEHGGEDAESVAPQIGRNMDSASEAILAPWKPVFVILDFPAKPIIRPISSHVWRSRLEALRAKEISREQFRIEGMLVALAASFLNSLALGLLVFVALVPLRHKRAP
jgi:hypothetical protein